METFKSLIKAVEENRDFHGASWKSWEEMGGASHIQDIYGKLSDDEAPFAIFLDALVRDDGENIEVYLDAHNAWEYGQVFSK